MYSKYLRIAYLVLTALASLIVVYNQLAPTTCGIKRVSFASTPSKSGKSCFTMYYAPWCPHCKKTMPVWDRLEREYTSVHIRKVDCEADPAEAKKLKIPGYPSFIYFPDGPDNHTNRVTYEGPRNYDAFVAFLSKQ